MPRLSIVCLVSLLLVACGGNDTNEDGATAAATTGDPQETGDTGETSGGDPVCFPEGSYGPCSTSMGCQCVLGGDIYQACTRSCTDVSDCGDPADFPGATPVCAPVNPGDPAMICSLSCATSADCPCGLECQPLYLICVEAQ